jgi:hypothetical protein
MSRTILRHNIRSIRMNSRINPINNLDINLDHYEHYESEIDADYPAKCPNCYCMDDECWCDEINVRLNHLTQDIKSAYYNHTDPSTLPPAVYTPARELRQWRATLQVPVRLDYAGGGIVRTDWSPEVKASWNALTLDEAQARRDNWTNHFAENPKCTCMICTRKAIVHLTRRMEHRQRTLPVPGACGMCADKYCNWAEHMRYGDEYLEEYMRTGVHTFYWEKVRRMPEIEGMLADAELSEHHTYVWEQLAQISVNDKYSFEVDYDRESGIMRVEMTMENPQIFRYFSNWESVGQTLRVLINDHCNIRVTKQDLMEIKDVCHSYLQNPCWSTDMVTLETTWEKMTEQVGFGAVQFNVKITTKTKYPAPYQTEQSEMTGRDEEQRCESCGAEIYMGERRCIVGECPVVLAKWQEEVRLGYHDSPAYESPCMCEMCQILKPKTAADVVEEAVPHSAGCDCSGCVWNGACGCGCGGVSALHVEWEAEREAQRQDVVHETVSPPPPTPTSVDEDEPETPRPSVAIPEPPPAPAPVVVVKERDLLTDIQMGLSVAVVSLMIGAYLCSIACF